MSDKDPFNPTLKDEVMAGLFWMLFWYGLIKLIGFTAKAVWMILVIAFNLLIRAPYRLYKNQPANIFDVTVEEPEYKLPKGCVADAWGNIRKVSYVDIGGGVSRTVYDPPGPITIIRFDREGPGPNPFKGVPNIHDKR